MSESDGSSLVATRAIEAADEADAALSFHAPPPLAPPASAASSASSSSSSSSSSSATSSSSPPPSPSLAPIARQDSAAAAAAATAQRASQVLGLGLMLLSCLCFSAMALFQSLVGDAVPSLVSTCVRFGLQCTLTLLAIAALRRDRPFDAVTWLGRPEKRFMLARRGLWGVGGMSAYFYSLSQIPLSEASTLAFLNVPLTAIFAHWLLGEPYGPFDAATAAVAFAGVIVITQPAALFGGSASQMPPLLVAIIFVGCVCSSMAYITIRLIGPGEDPLVVTLWFAVVGSLCSPVLAALFQGFGDGARWDARIVWLELGIGVTGFLGQILLNRGLALAPAGPATVMRYTEIVFGLVFQATLLGAPPQPLKVLGCFLVMSCRRRGRRQRRSTCSRRPSRR